MWTLTSSGAAQFKAGINANWADCSGAYTDWATQAEGRIEAETRRTWVANYSGLPTGIKGLLNDVASSLIAIRLINADMSGFTSRQEAGTMLDVNDSIAREGLAILKDFKSNELKAPS